MRRRIRNTAVAAATVVVLGAAGCGASTGSDDPVDTVDARGVINCGITVSPNDAIQRAVAVNQPAVELLLSLGLADRLSGVALGDDRLLPELEPAASEVYAFDTEFPSFESVLDREPDFVYTTFDYTFTDEASLIATGSPEWESPRISLRANAPGRTPCRIPSSHSTTCTPKSWTYPRSSVSANAVTTSSAICVAGPRRLQEVSMPHR